MIARVDDHPFSAEFLARVHMPSEITLDAIAHVGSDLGDIDGGHRMHADMDAFSFA